MSQYTRRTLAALGLMAVLLLTAPAPSRAAGVWEIPDLMPGITARVRTWLEVLLPGPRKAAGRNTKQGSGVDPNGGSVSTTPGTTTNQGSGVDPNGIK